VQGNVDKAVVVIKNKENVALERFIFAIQNMIQVESYDKDSRFVLITFVRTSYPEFHFLCSVEDAMTSIRLGQYFRSFLTRLTMVEAQLGVMPRTGALIVYAL
jgi:mitotic spindle assembly checkpoint protein MAD2B